MAQVTESRHGMWSSRWVFVLAVAGAAIGLGNIWDFSAAAGAHGGGAFVLAYVACLALFGVPLLMAELLLGRAGRLSPINTLRRLTHLTRRNAAWISIGWSAAFAGLLILSYTGVFAGWALRYVWVMAHGSLAGADASLASTTFNAFIASPWQVVAWQSAFMAVIVSISRHGTRGLDAAIRRLMPVVLILLAALIAFALASGDVGRGAAVLFQPRWAELHLDGVLVAMGHAVFTLGLGMGAIMAYGSYVPAAVPLFDSAAAVVALDVLVTLGAGFIVLALVSAGGTDAGTGFTLVFVSLPLAIAQLPYGALFGALLFVLIAAAAIVTAIGLLEPLVAYLVEEYNAKRSRAAVSLGVIVWVLGLGSAFSFSVWSHWSVLGDRTFFATIDYVVHTWMIPLGVLGTVLFVAFVVQPAAIRVQLHVAGDGSAAERAWNVFVRWIAPLFVLTVFVGIALRNL